jgi:hypothetical protein
LALRTFGTLAITFGIAFAILYTERLNWPLFTFHPITGAVDFWRQPTGIGPLMFWCLKKTGSSFVRPGDRGRLEEGHRTEATPFCKSLGPR